VHRPSLRSASTPEVVRFTTPRAADRDKTRARRVQGTAGSRPVSGTARSERGRAARGVPRSRAYRIRVRLTRRRTTMRIPCPRHCVCPPAQHDPESRSFRPRLSGRADHSPDVPEIDGSGALVAPAVATGRPGVCWYGSTTSRGYLRPSCLRATGRQRSVMWLSVLLSSVRQPSGQRADGRPSDRSIAASPGRGPTRVARASIGDRPRCDEARRRPRGLPLRRFVESM
jgi:hypothetical protein